MAEKCNTPECLRGVDNAGEQCMPCELGMPPMKNAKSPHSYTSKVKGNTAKPSHKKPKKDVITVEKGGKVTIWPDKTMIVTDKKGTKTKVKPSLAKIVQASQKPKKEDMTVKEFIGARTGGRVTILPEDQQKHIKSSAQIEQLQKDAVKVIFSSYWYGWEGGIPPAFKDIFSKFGAFISDRAIASKMQGTPDVHKSSINVAGDKSFILIKEAIYPYEGEAAAFKAIQMSPIMMEKLGDVTPTDAIEMVKNDGEAFTFTKTKPDGSEYSYEDPQGVVRKLPRWAIA